MASLLVFNCLVVLFFEDFVLLDGNIAALRIQKPKNPVIKWHIRCFGKSDYFFSENFDHILCIFAIVCKIQKKMILRVKQNFHRVENLGFHVPPAGLFSLIFFCWNGNFHKIFWLPGGSFL